MEPCPFVSPVLKRTGTCQRVKVQINFSHSCHHLSTFVTFITLDTAIDESCDYFSASCDHLLDYCILTCSGPTLPFTLLVKFDKENDKFEPVQNLESNDVQREAIADLQLPTVQNFVVPEDSGEDARSTNMLVISLKLSVRFSLSLSSSRGSLPQWQDDASSWLQLKEQVSCSCLCLWRSKQPTGGSLCNSLCNM